MSGYGLKYLCVTALFFFTLLTASKVVGVPQNADFDAIRGTTLKEGQAGALSSKLSSVSESLKYNKDPRLAGLGQSLQHHLTAVQHSSRGSTSTSQKSRSKKQLNRDVDLRLRPDNGTVRQLKVRAEARQRGVVLHPADVTTPPGRARNERTARNFLEANRSLLKLARPGDEMRLKGYEKDGLGRCHLRFSQFYRGIAVWPAELNVHLDPKGNVDLLNGTYVPTPRRMSTNPVITADEAVLLAQQEVALDQVSTARPAELIIYSPGDRKNRLAWKIRVTVSPVSDWLVVVDAMTGKILDSYNQLMNSNVLGSGTDLFGQSKDINVWYNDQGTYFMIDTSKDMYDVTSQPPDLDKIRGAYVVIDAQNQPPTDNPTELPTDDLIHITSASPTSGWLDEGVSLSSNLSSTYDYYRNVHGWQSHDGQGGKVTAIVQLGQNYANAAMNGENNFMIYGDADTYTGALDVVGHEFQHGVTYYTARLVYKDQSGALNEAYSDIFGEMVEAYTLGSNDWMVGTNLTNEDTKRSLSDPASRNIQAGLPYPDSMSKYINTTEDNGGVHLNNTIVTHAYFLLAAGLNNAIGSKDAEKIFFRALRYHLVNNSQFIDARLACITSAEELWLDDAVRRNAVIDVIGQAFDQVEIKANQATSDPIERTPVEGSDSVVFLYDWYGANYLARCEDGACYDLSYNYTAELTKPSVSGDGSLAIFVSDVNDLCFVETDALTVDECLGIAGNVFSVAMSPDTRHWAFVFIDPDTGLADNTITVYDYDLDFNLQQERTFNLVAPVMDGVSTSTIVLADALDFSGDNRYLFYDAFNELQLADGTSQGVWSIYAIDLATNQTLAVVPPVPGFDIGFPATSQTSDTFLTFDAYDIGSNLSAVYAFNVVNGNMEAVVGVSGGYGIPCYLGDDSGIVYSDSGSLYQKMLEADRITPTADPAFSLNIYGSHGVVYRRGTYTPPTANLELSSTQLTFGDVTVGKSVSQTLTLSNTGTADLTITSLTLEGTAPTEFDLAAAGCQGQTLTPSGSCTITAFFEPTTAVARTATLAIGYQQPAATLQEVALSGTGVAVIYHTITAGTGPNGTITPSGFIQVEDGSSQVFAITPAEGYHVADVQVNTVPVGASSSYTFTSVTEDQTISANFAANQLMRPGDVNLDGAITLADVIKALQITAGYPLGGGDFTAADVNLDSRIGLAEALYVLQTIVAQSASYTIHASSGDNGTIDPEGTVMVGYNEQKTFTITPNSGFHVLDVTVDGNSVGAVRSYTFYSVHKDHTLAASFEADSASYTIHATAGSNGSIIPAGDVIVASNGAQSFTFTPAAGYVVADVLINGVSKGAHNSYTIDSVTADGTIHVVFIEQTHTGGPVETVLIKEAVFGRYDVVELINGFLEQAVEAIWYISELNGAPTFNGTLTQVGTSDNFTYSPSPADKLVIVLTGGKSYELSTSANLFAGFSERGSDDFLKSHNVEFSVYRQGEIDVTITSRTGPIDVGNDLPYDYLWLSFDRTIKGSVQDVDGSTTVDFRYQGIKKFSDPSGSIIFVKAESTISGTATSAVGSVAMTVGDYYSWFHDGNTNREVETRKQQINSTVNYGQDTLEIKDYFLATHSEVALEDVQVGEITYPAQPVRHVIEPHNWTLAGAVYKNDVLYGEFDKDGALIAGAWGTAVPNIIVRRVSGETIVLFRPIQPNI